MKTGVFVFLRMQHIQGISRYQVRFSSLEDAITLDNQSRFTKAFTTFLDLVKLGINRPRGAENCQAQKQTLPGLDLPLER